MKRQITKQAVMAEIREELKEEREFLDRVSVLFKKAEEHREWLSIKDEVYAEASRDLWEDWGQFNEEEEG